MPVGIRPATIATTTTMATTGIRIADRRELPGRPEDPGGTGPLEGVPGAAGVGTPGEVGPPDAAMTGSCLRPVRAFTQAKSRTARARRNSRPAPRVAVPANHRI